jgi:hypothetical protein
MAHGGVDQRIALRWVADVGGNRKGSPADTDDLSTDLGQPVGATGAEHDICAGFG